MQQQATIQQKQNYLRSALPQNMYDNFAEYCERQFKVINIEQWSMKQLENIVKNFKIQEQQKVLKESLRHGKYSYNDYQSKNPDQKLEQGQYQEESEISEVRNSKVAKTSAVSLLDEVIQSQTKSNSIKSQAKELNNQNKSFFYDTPQNTNKNNSMANFDQFDFWTSNIGSNTPKSSTQMRNKSTSQYRVSKPTNLGGSPPTPKNTYNMPDYGLINPNYNTNINMNINLNTNQPNRASRFPTQQTKLSNNDFDIFAHMDTAKNNKTSPYIKKQIPHQHYQGSKINTIKLKQVRQINQIPTRGLSVNDKGRSKINNQVSFNQTINCYKSAIRNQLADRALNIFIDKHEIIQRKFLAADYAMYNIKIVPLGIECKRNYQDFSKLRDNLGKFFPGIHLPYLQQTSWFSGTNAQYISNQKKMLQLFARDLIRNKEFRNSRVMEDFLTLKDHKAIKRKFEKYEQMQKLKGIQQLCLLQGKVNVKISPQQKKYIDQLQKFIPSINQLYERYQNLTQNLISQYHQLIKTLKSLTNLMFQIQKQIKQFNTKNTINIIKHLGQSIKIVRQSYEKQVKFAQFQSQINSMEILPFLKYERKNFNQLNKLIQAQKKLKRAFDKRSLTQKIGVGETYLSQSAKGTKKGVLQESDSLIVLKHQVGYIGNQVTNQGQRIFDELAIKTLARWQSIGSSYLDKLSDRIGDWKKINSNDLNRFNTQLTF